MACLFIWHLVIYVTLQRVKGRAWIWDEILTVEGENLDWDFMRLDTV
jgi:hypothetical protein